MISVSNSMNLCSYRLHYTHDFQVFLNEWRCWVKESVSAEEDSRHICFATEWRTCTEVIIGTAHIRPGDYIVALKSPTSEDLWVGKVSHVYRHSGTHGTGDIIIFKMASWFSGMTLAEHDDYWDMTMKLPCITKEGVNLAQDPYNMLWPAKWTAPLSGVVVVPHPSEPCAQVVLHKHIDFLETAGYHYDMRNPQDRQSKSKTSVELMEEEHNLRQHINRTLDMDKRQMKIDAVINDVVDDDDDG